MLCCCVDFKELLNLGISSWFVGVDFKEAATEWSYSRICFNPIVSPSTYSKWVVKEAAALSGSMQVYSVKHKAVAETALSGDSMLWQRCSISLCSNAHSCVDECMPASTFNRCTNTASAFPFHRYSYSQDSESHFVRIPRTLSFILNL